jgi:hypothetical protein
MSFREQDVGQYIVVPDSKWDPHQTAGRVALFDEHGNPYLPATAPTTLSALTDVSGTADPGAAPVAQDSGDFVLTPVASQAYVDEQVEDARYRWSELEKRMTYVSEFASPWEASNPTVVMTPDGVMFGPYADGAGAAGSIRFHGLDGQPFTAVKNLAYNMRYISDDNNLNSTPYLRVFTKDAVGADHDSICTGNGDVLGDHMALGMSEGPGPFQEYVATAGSWRYDSDDGSNSEFGRGVPLKTILDKYGDQVITRIAITVGWTAGVNLTGLLRWMQINGNRYTFGN